MFVPVKSRSGVAFAVETSVDAIIDKKISRGPYSPPLKPPKFSKDLMLLYMRKKSFIIKNAKLSYLPPATLDPWE